MSRKTFQLSAAVYKQLADLRSEMSVEVERMRDKFDTRSERFRESDEGGEVDTWLEALENLCTDLEGVEQEPAT
ncbi:MAG: hypothetical protein EKK42_20095 [Pseudonocardiaceae bacterium]|nr:MAG: hypothetical protein EKK42_20095 [Pseudonocardiaceae bacterium]